MFKQRLKLLVFLLLSFCASAQNDQIILNAINEYELDIDKYYNDITLNVLFAYSLENFISQSKTPSVKQFSANLDSDDSSFELSFTIDKRKGEVSKFLRNLVAFGIKLKDDSNNDFFNFFNSDGANNNILLTANYTWFFKGFITPSNDVRKKLKNYRESKISKKLISELEEKEDLSQNDVFVEIAKKEAEYVMEEDLFRKYDKIWLNTNIDVPLTKTENSVTQIADLFSPETFDFSPWSVNGSINYYRKLPKASFTLSANLTYSNNNNILTNEIKEKTFVQSTPMNNDFVVIEEKKAFVGDYKEFETTRLKLEFTSFLINDTVGLSGAVEENFGDFETTNWKLGIPFALKDSKGKNTVSFELQWREVNKEHFVGISIGKSFGKFVN
jgi:hypothetical protein